MVAPRDRQAVSSSRWLGEAGVAAVAEVGEGLYMMTSLALPLRLYLQKRSLGPALHVVNDIELVVSRIMYRLGLTHHVLRDDRGSDVCAVCSRI
jgi:hypothetical protein